MSNVLKKTKNCHLKSDEEQGQSELKWERKFWTGMYSGVSLLHLDVAKCTRCSTRGDRTGYFIHIWTAVSLALIKEILGSAAGRWWSRCKFGRFAFR